MCFFCASFVKDFVSYFSSPLKSFSGPGSGRPVFQLSSTLRCFNPLTRKRTLVFLTLLSYGSTSNKCTKFTGHSQLSKSGSRTVLHRVFFPLFCKVVYYSTRVCCGLVGALGLSFPSIFIYGALRPFLFIYLMTYLLI